MASQFVLISFSILLLMQVFHIFEEIGMEVYKVEKLNSKKTYLRISSIIMSFYIITFLVIALDLNFGTLFGVICSVFALINFIVHTIGYLKLKDYRGTIAAGVFSSIPLGIAGIITLIFLLN